MRFTPAHRPASAEARLLHAFGEFMGAVHDAAAGARDAAADGLDRARESPGRAPDTPEAVNAFARTTSEHLQTRVAEGNRRLSEAVDHTRGFVDRLTQSATPPGAAAAPPPLPADAPTPPDPPPHPPGPAEPVPFQIWDRNDPFGEKQRAADGGREPAPYYSPPGLWDRNDPFGEKQRAAAGGRDPVPYSPPGLWDRNDPFGQRREQALQAQQAAQAALPPESAPAADRPEWCAAPTIDLPAAGVPSFRGSLHSAGRLLDDAYTRWRQGRPQSHPGHAPGAAPEPAAADARAETAAARPPAAGRDPAPADAGTRDPAGGPGDRLTWWQRKKLDTYHDWMMDEPTRRDLDDAALAQDALDGDDAATQRVLEEQSGWGTAAGVRAAKWVAPAATDRFVRDRIRKGYDARVEAAARKNGVSREEVEYLIERHRRSGG